LLKSIEEFGKYVAIAGFRNARIKDAEEFLNQLRTESNGNVEIQLFDAQLVATWEHLYFATLNALTAFKNKSNISKSLAMETLLYTSAQHQIRKATELLGIKPACKEIVVLILGNNTETVENTLTLIQNEIHAKLDDSILEISTEKTRRIREAFGITDVELKAVANEKSKLKKAVVNLVIERVALLATER
jgi:tRNA threonylcarbamoyladenosine modification (KEOPS) complex Cgi121 subunit